MRRMAIFSLVMFTAVILQTALFARLTVFRVAPDLILVAVISFALVDGAVAGATSGFAGGLLRDLLLDAPKGITALAYLLVGYLVGSIRPYVRSTSVFVPITAIFLGSFAGSILYVVFSALLGQAIDPMSRVTEVAGLTALYNALLGPFVYPVVRRVATLYQRETVFW
ncbi:MAG: rod shape-determining protein MreD [Actinomycetota bacterium]